MNSSSPPVSASAERFRDWTPGTRIHGSGEMADLIRLHPWERTLLGGIDSWSPELVLAVHMVLATKVAATLYWGDERVMLYNDLYRPYLAKHPVLGKTLREAWPTMHTSTEAMLRACFETGESILVERVPVRCESDGVDSEKIYTFLTDPIWAETEHGAQVVGVYHTATDHTANVLEQRASERERAAIEEELAWTVKLNSSIPWTADVHGKILDFSERWLHLTGLSREEAGGDGWLQVPHPDDRERMLRAWTHSLATGEPYDVEHRIRNASNEYCWMRSRAFPRRDSTGSIVKWYGTIEDISDRKKSEAALEESQTRIKAIYDSTHEYLGLLTPDGTLIDCNRSALTFADSTLDEIIGTVFWETPWFSNTPGAGNVLRTWIERAAAGEFIREEVSLLRPNGETTVFDFALTPILDEQGKVSLLVPEGRDITELKRAEMAVMQIEKLAAVGRLAASIAHEINNPLESVTNLLYLARNNQDLGEIQAYLDTAERELRRVSAISNQTLRFYRQSSKQVSVTCENLLDSALSIYQGRLVNSRVQLEKRKLAHSPVLCFDGEIRQVLNNIIGNAIDAMHPGGGRLLIRSREATNWKTGEPGLVITVADTGPGMSAVVMSKIFQAFFTTKGIGGTGLGLWVSLEIVQRHRGTLRCRSSQKPGHTGTVFTLFLPFVPAGR